MKGVSCEGHMGVVPMDKEVKLKATPAKVTRLEFV